ncbi:hypothetical protein L596_016410 [Steinernema carpocapsae]|uniref:Uncharacterized protein n=1 Tax=Steinernema carpocapsae TaxID=34508 RepID=A0A4U5NHW9_STECR|nr:hypothetical protein L596_016410 [Steinernema carpocapsae]
MLRRSLLAADNRLSVTLSGLLEARATTAKETERSKATTSLDWVRRRLLGPLSPVATPRAPARLRPKAPRPPIGRWPLFETTVDGGAGEDAKRFR